MRKLVIIGASGHGKVVADIAEKNEYKNIVFLDDSELTECAGFPVVGRSTDAWLYKETSEFVIAIGKADIRQKIQESLKGYEFAVLVHPNASVSRNVEIGKGTVVMAGAVINSNSVVGRGCIINTGASIDHDDKIGDYVHISVGAHIAGSVTVGSRSWLGIGSCVINNLHICSDCMIGAGAVVIRDINERGTYVGNPARRIR